jgi:chromosome segregation ATPase
LLAFSRWTMKQNVNFALLGLLLVVIVSMIGLVIYYYTTYEGLSARYDEALVNLENISREVNQTQVELLAKEAQLREKEKTLLSYLSELNLSKERETTLGSHFTELRGEVTGLEEDLNSTLDERNRYASLYDKYYAESQEWRGRYDQEHLLLTSANNKIGRVKGDAIEMETHMDSIKEKVDSIYGKTSSIKGDAGDIEDIAKDIGNQTIEDAAYGIQGDVDDVDDFLLEIEDYLDSLKSLAESIKGS